MKNVKKLFVIFKTHLDIGFTDFSSSIYKMYMEKYIPNALQTARKLRELNSDAKFVWTTGSWLIYKYVKTLSKEQYAEFSKQVELGDIRWHGLPFTTHTELMDGELFESGLSISKELDRRFGVKTVACKMTDVPGHTRAIVPYLAKYGMEFLHIGVNPASAVPDVPPLFTWKAPTGESITVMYNGDYGTCSMLGDTGSAVYFAHAHDNFSPPTAEEICELFVKLKREYPNAQIIASDLNAVAYELRCEVEKLPVITDEIGDSWIHGVGTDPEKVSQFRSLLRFRESINDNELRSEFNRRLLLIPEHTWGLDEKTHLGDHNNFSKEQFYAVKTTPPYRKMEDSWEEQRSYLTDAISILPRDIQISAVNDIKSYKRNSVLKSMENTSEVSLNSVIDFDKLSLSFDNDGAINFLKKDGDVYADCSHKFASWSYTQLGPDDYKRFFKQYIRSTAEWALEDFDKIGMQNSVKCRIDYTPKLEKLLLGRSFVTAIIKFPKDANEKYGAPQWVETTVVPTNDGFDLDVAWFNKPANRCAEMLNLGFGSFDSDLKIRKLGEWIIPDVVPNGSHNLHSSDYGISYKNFDIKSFDAPLVSIGKPAVLDFQNIDFDRSKVFFNLYNNAWGTNFPMWYSEDARFRFSVILK